MRRKKKNKKEKKKKDKRKRERRKKKKEMKRSFLFSVVNFKFGTKVKTSKGNKTSKTWIKV